MLIQPEECLTAKCIGIDYVKPKYILSQFFNEILDTAQEIEEGNLDFKLERQSLTLHLGGLKIIFGVKKLTIISKIVIQKKIVKSIFGESNLSEENQIYNFWGSSFSDVPLIIQDGSEHHKALRSFFDDTSSILSTLLDIVEDTLPEIRFVGYIQFYLIPISSLNWTKLADYDKQAEIGQAQMTEKVSRNRYRFPEDKTTGDQDSLIFHLHIPEEDLQRAEYAGASFDFQRWPQRPKSLKDFGEPKDLIRHLHKDSLKKINDAELLNFMPSERGR